MTKLFISLFISFLLSTSLHGTTARLSLRVDKTAYLQWLNSAYESMSRVSPGGPKELRLGGGQHSTELHLGVMCNSLGGYSIQIQSHGATSANTLSAQGAFSNKTVHLFLSAEQGSLKSGTTASTNLDITGGSPSVTVSYSNGNSLPMEAHAPNVFTLHASLQDDGQMGTDFYSNFITATISLH